jgi:hypothetical protein
VVAGGTFSLDAQLCDLRCEVVHASPRTRERQHHTHMRKRQEARLP